ncbi:MAG: hypothetical protein WC875_03730 [Candidatus Absconditabacterales bacterium]|jgi:hypothetical protein
METKKNTQKNAISWLYFIISGAACTISTLVHEPEIGWILVLPSVMFIFLAMREFCGILDDIPAQVKRKDVTMALVVTMIAGVLPLIFIWLQEFWWRAIGCTIILIVAIALSIHFNRDNEN